MTETGPEPTDARDPEPSIVPLFANSLEFRAEHGGVRMHINYADGSKTYSNIYGSILIDIDGNVSYYRSQ